MPVVRRQPVRQRARWRSSSSGAGATKPARDSVDTRIVNTVNNHTGTIINDEGDVGGWPSLAAGTTPTDTDSDGMPDSWEDSNGTNKNVAANNGDGLVNGGTWP